MSILNPLADLVAWVIMRIHAVLGALFGPASGLAWGLSIVILVVLIRVCLIPLFVKQVHAQRKMAQHAPHLAELRKKYKNDKQRLNEETMKFYKENGVNPLAGCLPMIPQMIIFFALFYVLREIAEWKPGQVPKYGLTVPVLESAQKATIFGVHLYDKLLFPHTPGMGLVPSIVAAITVALSATTTFMTVRQTSKRGLMQTNVDPDNPMAAVPEVHDVHRPVLLADGFVLAVRAGAVLGDDQRVDARPAVRHVPELGHRAGAGRRGRRGRRVPRLGPPRARRVPAPRAGGRCRAARTARAANGTKTAGAAKTGSGSGGAQAGAAGRRPVRPGGRCAGRHGRIRLGEHRLGRPANRFGAW